MMHQTAIKWDGRRKRKSQSWGFVFKQLFKAASQLFLSEENSIHEDIA